MVSDPVSANIARSLTSSSDDECCEEPSSLLDHLPDMVEGCGEEKENKYYCCCNRGIVMIQLKAGRCLLLRHLIGFLFTSVAHGRPEKETMYEKKIT